MCVYRQLVFVRSFLVFSMFLFGFQKSDVDASLNRTRCGDAERCSAMLRNAAEHGVVNSVQWEELSVSLTHSVHSRQFGVTHCTSVVAIRRLSVDGAVVPASFRRSRLMRVVTSVQICL